MDKHAFALNSFSVKALAWQAAMVILLGTCASYQGALAPSHGPTGINTGAQLGVSYAMFADVHVMMAIGFGFLYTLLRRYAWSGVSINYVLCAFCLQWGLLCLGFWRNVRARYTGALPPDAFPAIPINLEGMINADYTVATVLISFGAVLGRLSPTQALWLAFFEVACSTANVVVCEHLGVADVGGSMVIHVFGAAFGLAFAAVLGDRALQGQGNGERALGTSRHNGTFAMIGTLFLFCFWPSFNGALLANDAQARAAMNTTLSICASVATAFALSKAIHGGRVFDMEHIQNATLAGGVAIGACCDMLLNPGAAAAVGAVAGVVSTYGFSYATPALKRAGLTDTCGIFNLHFLPGVLGGVASAIAAAGMAPSAGGWSAAAIKANFHGRGERSALVQGGFQMAMVVISAAWGAGAGAAVAWGVRGHSVVEPMADSFYEDAGLWNVPADAGEEAPELESAVALKLAQDRKRLGESCARARVKVWALRSRSFSAYPLLFLSPPSPPTQLPAHCPRAPSGGHLQGRGRCHWARDQRAQGPGAGAGAAGDAGGAAGEGGGAKRQ
jgi:ammonium transporter Rh